MIWKYRQNYYEYKKFFFKDRKTDYEFDYKTYFDSEITIVLPAGYKIEKIPFQPKVGEYYWTYACCGLRINIVQLSWCNDYFDKERKSFGNVFRTEQEAKDYLPTWKKRLEGEELWKQAIK